ncbi:MAG: hypothetical protein KME05_12530 [Gloeocapsa sp. UFS-A4-WI-NPMV-4B04]|jgi:hypothetical protein|nr:hypothetical protein [Gloeocapsa sp. UFS-A4-WI-NPMV-4B04]
MLYKNGLWGKALKAIFGVVALLTVSGGLVSCDIGGEGEEGEEGEETEQGEEDDDD